MRENFLSLVKEINIQAQEAHRVPDKFDPQKTTPRYIIIKMPKVKDKERHLKATEKSKALPTKEYPKDRQSADFFAGKKRLARSSIQSDKKQGPTT